MYELHLETGNLRRVRLEARFDAMGGVAHASSTWRFFLGQKPSEEITARGLSILTGGAADHFHSSVN